MPRVAAAVTAVALALLLLLAAGVPPASARMLAEADTDADLVAAAPAPADADAGVDAPAPAPTDDISVDTAAKLIIHWDCTEDRPEELCRCVKGICRPYDMTCTRNKEWCICGEDGICGTAGGYALI